MDLPAPFGKYQLLERIATGGMAEVFLARSHGVEGFEKHLVIKRILPALARSPHFKQMFVREAKISALLSHPNIVQVYDLGREGDDHYIAMEHIHGRDLTRTVRRLRAQNQRLPMGMAVYVTACVARGLAYAHGRMDPQGRPAPIVHRDVSPHNVILSFEGEVKLVDFGIARLLEDAQDAPEESGQPGGGKFAYMSPEQAVGGRVDHRSDLFSCGIVLYELLVNHRLFQDPDPAEKLRQVREAIIPDPRIEVPEIPERLWEILQKTLRRDPDQRYQSAALLEEDLRAFLFEAGLRADAASVHATLRELFGDELGPDPSALQLHTLAAELSRLEDGTESSQTGGESTSSTIERSELSRPRPIGEKKAVAVLVAEIVGLTDASELVEPEEMLRQQDKVLAAVRRVAERYDAFLDRPGHDTLTLLFGVPRALEDDLDRALGCAQDLLRAVQRLRRKGQPVELAMGLHKGEVAVSGTEDELSYLPRGNVVKLARRLAALADPGELRVSDLAASQAGDRWRFEPGPRIRMKGRRKELATFVLVGRRRRARGGPGGRWIRRSGELDVLAQAITGLAEGRGGVLGVSGEAGVGKSRLVRELSGLCAQARVPCYVARSYPYGNDRPLAPFRDIVAHVLGLELDDEPELQRARLHRLTELGVSEADVDTLGEFFALGGERQPSKEDIYGAGASFIRGLAADRPALLVLEDLQYMPTFERQLLSHLVRASAGRRVLWLLTWRGRKSPNLLPVPSEEIRLGALDQHARTLLIRDALAARDVDPRLVAFIDRSASGNPLYIVELVKALQQRGLVRFEGRRAVYDEPSGEPLLPPTLEGLITARVDSLDPASKGALQIAATVGLSFSSALVAEATGIDEAEPLFKDLREAGLIQVEGEGVYGFASHLVWQVVRRSILGVALRDHHRLVAEGMERLYDGRLEAHYDALAGHCAASGRLLDAARYTKRAGDQHRKGAFLERALQCYERGVAWLEDAGDEAGSMRGEAMLHLEAGEIAYLLGMTQKAQRHLQLALELAAESGSGDLEMRCYLALGRVYSALGRPVLARASFEQGLTEARLRGAVESQVSLLTDLAGLACSTGSYAQAEELLREALDMAQDSASAAVAHLGLGNRFIRDDHPEQAWAWLEKARELAEDSGDRILLGRIYNNLGIALHALGRYEAALGWFRKALDVRRGSGYRQGLVINLHNIGDAHLRLNRLGRAHAAFLEARDLARETGLERQVALNEVYLGYLAALREDSSGGLAQLGSATDRARKLGDEETWVVGRWLRARILRKLGREGEARALLDQALADAREIGSAWIARDIESELL